MVKHSSELTIQQRVCNGLPVDHGQLWILVNTCLPRTHYITNVDTFCIPHPAVPREYQHPLYSRFMVIKQLQYRIDTWQHTVDHGMPVVSSDRGLSPLALHWTNNQNQGDVVQCGSVNNINIQMIIFLSNHIVQYSRGGSRALTG